MKKLIAFLLLLPVFALADPGAATRYLINEPASLMDIGLVRINLFLRDEGDDITETLRVLGQEDARVISVARYDFASDVIVIEYFISNVSDKKETCRGVLENVVGLQIMIPRLIGHTDYSSGDEPEDLSASIAHRVEVRCLEWATPGSTIGRRMLTKEEIFWTGDDE